MEISLRSPSPVFLSLPIMSATEISFPVPAEYRDVVDRGDDPPPDSACAAICSLYTSWLALISATLEACKSRSAISAAAVAGSIWPTALNSVTRSLGDQCRRAAPPIA